MRHALTIFLAGLLGVWLATASSAQTGKSITSLPPLIEEGEVFDNLPELVQGISLRGAMRSIAFSPDGSLLASGGSDGTIRLWDVASGREVSRLEGHLNEVPSVSFSADGSRLASGGSDGTIRLWDVASGREVSRLEGHLNEVPSVSFSADGSRLASGGSDGTVRLWDVASGREVSRLEGHLNEVPSVSFSADGSRLASGGSDGTVRLWDVASGREVSRLEGHRSFVYSVAFSADGSRLASGGSDGTVRLWDVASGREVSRLEGHRGGVFSVAFSPDGSRLASGGSDGTVRLWDVASGREVSRLEGHRGWVFSVAFSPDGSRLASGGDEGMVRFWDVASGREVSRLEGHRGGVFSVAFSADGSRLASVGSDGTIRLWDVASGHEVSRLEGHRYGVFSVAFSPDGSRLASDGSDGTVRLWDVASGREESRLEGHRGGVLSVAFSADGSRLASGGDDGAVRLWDVASGREESRLEGHRGGVLSVAFSADGSRLASGGDDGAVRLWDVASGREVSRLEGHRGGVSSVAFSADGSRLASGGDEGMVRFWDVASGHEVSRLEGHRGGVFSVAFSADGSRLASGGDDGAVRLWDVASGRELGFGIGGARDTWLSCQSAGRRCWRADDGSLLMRNIGDAAALEPVVPSHSPTDPRFTQDFAPSIEFTERRGAELSVKIRNIGQEPIFWVRVRGQSGVIRTSSAVSLAVAPSEVIQRLEPNATRTVTVRFAAHLPRTNPRKTEFQVPLVLETAGATVRPIGTITAKVLVPNPRLDAVRLGETVGNSRPLVSALLNEGTAPLNRLEVDATLHNEKSEALGKNLTIVLPKEATLAAAKDARVPLTFAPEASTDVATPRTLKAIVRDPEHPIHEWQVEAPIEIVQRNWLMIGSIAILVIMAVMSLGYYQGIYRHPLSTRVGRRPEELLKLDPEELSRAKWLLGWTFQLLGVLQQAGSQQQWLSKAIDFLKADPAQRAKQIAERLDARLDVEPAMEPRGIKAFRMKMPGDFVLGIDDLILVVPAADVPAPDVFAAWRTSGLGSRPVGVVVSTDQTQRRNLVRGRDPRAESVVVLDGGDITRLLLAPDPLKAFAGMIASQIDLVRISPYQINSAVERETIFFGRMQYMHQILNRQPTNYIVVGARQLGKSSLLKAIERRIRERGDMTVRYLQVGVDPILTTLARAAEVDESVGLDGVVAELRRRGRERPLMLLLDEVDLFVKADQFTDPPFAVMDAMRALSSERLCFFIIAGFWQLFEMAHISYFAPLRNFGETLTLGALETEAAARLLVEPMASVNVVWESAELVELIVVATGRRPNLLQIVGNQILRDLGQRRVIAAADVERALQSRALGNALAGWRRLGEDKRGNAVDQLVVWSMIDRERFTLSELRKRVAAFSGSAIFSTEELQLSLQRLELAFIVGEDQGTFSWRVPLFRERRLMEAPADQLADQLIKLREVPLPG